MRQTIRIILSLFWAISCTGKQTKTNSLSANKSSEIVDSNVDNHRDSVTSESADSILDLMRGEGFGELKIGLDYKQVLTNYGIPDKQSKVEILGVDGEYHQKVNFTTKGYVLDVVGDIKATRTVNMITIKKPIETKDPKMDR